MSIEAPIDGAWSLLQNKTDVHWGFNWRGLESITE